MLIQGNIVMQKFRGNELCLYTPLYSYMNMYIKTKIYTIKN